MNFEAYSKIVADSPAQIRRCDVFRLLYTCPAVQLPELVFWLMKARPNLGGEVEECLTEIRLERGAS
jgi:hypothetical protein